jgi:NAD(P)-dependent dehydrogenase (short-subunit alcohol dehydrogenase family)
MREFSGKVAVVTGAGSGIGRGLATLLARSGARLAISDINAEGLEETAQLIRSEHPNIELRTYALDVSSREAVFAHADQVKADFGTAHFVFNNAGVTLVAMIANMKIEELEWLLGINLWGVIYGTKAFLPMMLEQNEGHIINVSSVFGFVTVPTQSAYHISKFGVRGFTECLSRELALDKECKVYATCVHPGAIDTNIARSARFGDGIGDYENKLAEDTQSALITPPEEMAKAILNGVRKRKRRVVAGSSAKMVDWIARLFPASYGRVLDKLQMVAAKQGKSNGTTSDAEES